MWIATLVLLVSVGLAVYRIGLSVARVRATRAGDTDRAEHLAKKRFAALGATLALTFVSSIVMVVVLAVTH